MAAKHGTRRCYLDGCRCDPCSEVNATYQREYRLRKKQPPGTAPETVTALPGASVGPVNQVGAAERAVLEELVTLTSADTRKGAAEAALALARILDNPKAINNHVQAAKALPVVLEDLRKGSARKKGRLASVQPIRRRDSSTA
jgi:hypothetical protein